MSITYNWIISQLNCYPQDAGQTDVVFTVHWTLNGTDGTYDGSIYGTSNVTYTSGEPFTPYADLTESQVIGWVESALGPEQVIVLQANIAQQIQDQINPPVVSPPLPWA